MGKFTIFDHLKVRGELAVAGPLSAPNLPKTVKGSIAWDTPSVATKAKVGIALPAGAIVTRVAAVVTEAFNAATTNVLTVGYSDDTDALMGSSDITEGTLGAYVKERMDAPLAAAADVYAQYSQSGTEASKGKADIYVTYQESL